MLLVYLIYDYDKKVRLKEINATNNLQFAVLYMSISFLFFSYLLTFSFKSIFLYLQILNVNSSFGENLIYNLSHYEKLVPFTKLVIH